MANVGQEFPTTLEPEDLPPNGCDVTITEVFQQEALDNQTDEMALTWFLRVNTYPYKILKVTKGRGKTLVRLHGPETDGWLNKPIRLVASTNAGPHGKKYVVIDKAISQIESEQSTPPESPPFDPGQQPPPEGEENPDIAN